MQYLQGNILSLLGRVSAGVIAFISFYLALFLYEDQDGHWQNRLDGLWVSIHDRAKATDHFATALINKTSEILARLCDIIFGTKNLSLRMFVVSLNMSLGTGILCQVVWGFCTHPNSWNRAPIRV